MTAEQSSPVLVLDVPGSKPHYQPGVVNLWDPGTPEPSVGDLVEVSVAGYPDPPWSQVERAMVRSIIGPSVVVPPLPRLRKSYRDCRVTDHETGQLRHLTDDELLQQAKRGAEYRWVEVLFVEPCLDGSARHGIFSSYRAVVDE